MTDKEFDKLKKKQDLIYLQALNKARKGPFASGEFADCGCLACDAHVARRAYEILTGRKP